MSYYAQIWKSSYTLYGAFLGCNLANFAISNIFKNIRNDNENAVFENKILLWSMGLIAGGELGYSLGASLYHNIFNNQNINKIQTIGAFIGGLIGSSAAVAINVIISLNHELNDLLEYSTYTILPLGLGIGANFGYQFSTVITKIYDKCSATNIALINNETNNHTRQNIQNFESTPLLPNDISNINAINNTNPNQNIYNTVVRTPLLPK